MSYHTVRGAAKLLGVKPWRIRHLAKKAGFTREGGVWIFTSEEVERLAHLDRNTPTRRYFGRRSG